MAISDVYTTESIKLYEIELEKADVSLSGAEIYVKPQEKIVISEDAFAICKAIENLMTEVRKWRG